MSNLNGICSTEINSLFSEQFASLALTEHRLDTLVTDVLTLIAKRFFSSNDLTNFSQVSKSLYSIVIPKLWTQKKRQLYFNKWIQDKESFFYEKNINIQKLRKVSFKVTLENLLALNPQKIALLPKIYVVKTNEKSNVQGLKSGFPTTELNTVIDSITFLYKTSIDEIFKQTKDININVFIECDDIDISEDNTSEQCEKIVKVALKATTVSHLILVLSRCKNMGYLSIQGCQSVTNIPLHSIPLHTITVLPHLNVFDASSSTLTAEALANVLMRAFNLTSLSISLCKNIQNLNSYSLPVSTKLEEIKAFGSSISSEGLFELLKRSPHLKCLKISKCPNIANLDIPSLPELKQLQKIKSYRCSLSQELLQKLYLKCPNLKIRK